MPCIEFDAYMESENKDCVIFQQHDLFSQGFPIMEEIRRQGKLCDVTLKVIMKILTGVIIKIIFILFLCSNFA